MVIKLPNAIKPLLVRQILIDHYFEFQERFKAQPIRNVSSGWIAAKSETLKPILFLLNKGASCGWFIVLKAEDFESVVLMLSKFYAEDMLAVWFAGAIKISIQSAQHFVLSD